MSRVGTIKREVFERVASAVSLSEYMSTYIEVKKSGSNSVCNCPFHQDSSPSLYIYETHYHCFGCKAHGNIIDYEMFRTGMNFPETVVSLAEKFNIQVEYESTSSVDLEKQEKRQHQIAILNTVAREYQNVLGSELGNSAREYLSRRNFPEQAIRDWSVGLAPSYNFILELAATKGWSLEDLETLGLIKKRAQTGELYDFFRARVMFPIKDDRGNVVAFGGRIYMDYPPERTPPKYLNSPETPLFSKSKILYNLNNARPNILKSGRVIVVEGYMDCIALASAGITDVVAVLGTALSQVHVKKLSRVTQNLIVCFDSDKAGRDAAKRSFETVFPLNLMNLYYAELYDAKDPDEFLKKSGVDAFLKIIDNVSPLVKGIARQISAAHSSREARIRAIKEELVPVILKNPDEAQQEVVLSGLAEELGLSSFQTLKTGLASSPVVKEPDPLPESERQAAPTWKVKSADEMKFVSALVYSTFDDLPARLQNLLTDTASDTEMNETVCAQTLSRFLAKGSEEILNENLAFSIENREKRLCFHYGEVRGLAQKTIALCAFVTGDFNTLEELNLELLAPFKSQVRVNPFYPENVFDPRNLAFLKLWFKDLEISLRTGTLATIVRSLLLRLEIAFLDSDEAFHFEEALLNSNTSRDSFLALEQRRKLISTERERRGRELK